MIWYKDDVESNEVFDHDDVVCVTDPGDNYWIFIRYKINLSDFSTLFKYIIIFLFLSADLAVKSDLNFSRILE